MVMSKEQRDSDTGGYHQQSCDALVVDIAPQQKQAQHRQEYLRVVVQGGVGTDCDQRRDTADEYRSGCLIRQQPGEGRPERDQAGGQDEVTKQPIPEHRHGSRGGVVHQRVSAVEEVTVRELPVQNLPGAHEADVLLHLELGIQKSEEKGGDKDSGPDCKNAPHELLHTSPSLGAVTPRRCRVNGNLPGTLEVLRPRVSLDSGVSLRAGRALCHDPPTMLECLLANGAFARYCPTLAVTRAEPTGAR